MDSSEENAVAVSDGHVNLRLVISFEDKYTNGSVKPGPSVRKPPPNELSEIQSFLPGQAETSSRETTSQ